MKALKIILISIGSITVVAVIGIIIFINTALNETKEALFRDTPIEELGIDREIYVKCEINSFRRNIVNTKWVINGFLYCTNDKQNFTRQTIVFRFSDGDEYRDFNFHINGAQTLKRPFEVRFKGHDNAQFLGAEVVSADLKWSVVVFEYNFAIFITELR